MREKKLAINTLIIAIGKACTQLITFLLLPLYTSVLSTAEYGTVDLLNTLVGLALPIITLQIEQGVFRFLIEKRNDERGKKEIISSSFLLIIISCIAFSIFFMILSLFNSNEYKFLLFLNILIYVFPTYLLQVSRGLGNNKMFSLGSFIAASSTIMFNIIFILGFKLRVEGMLYGTMLGQICCSLFLFIKLKMIKYLSMKLISKKIIKDLIKYSAPLIPNSISWWVFNASDRIIVSFFLGLSATGLLSAANKFSAIYISAYSIIYMSWTESISSHIDDSDISDYFTKNFNLLMKFFVSVAFCLISFMPFLFKILINKKFIGGYNLIPVLIIASIFNVAVGLIGSFYVAKKNTKSIANTSILAALINIVVNLIFIKYIGLLAAAVSTFVSYFLMTIYRLHDLKKNYFVLKINNVFLYSSLLVAILLFILFYLDNFPLNLLSIIIALIYSLLFNKNTISLIFKFIMKKVKK